MPTKQQYKQHAGQEEQELQQRYALLGKQVMHALGQPDDLHRLQVCRLWEDHYRVNVFVGVDAASAKVAHSYFLVADGDGNIIESTPRITKRYEPVVEATGPLPPPRLLPPSPDPGGRKDPA